MLFLPALAAFVARPAGGFVSAQDAGHCLQWRPHTRGDPDGTLISVEGDSVVGGRAGDTVRLCRWLPARGCSGQLVGRASEHLPFGQIDADSGRCVGIGRLPARPPQGDAALCEPTAPGVAAGSVSARCEQIDAFEVATVDLSCDVWFRKVTADVIPPIPELLLPLDLDGAKGGSGGAKLVGLCRTFADHSSAPNRLGTVMLTEGPDFGNCFVTAPDGTTTTLEGGVFHVLQARVHAAAAGHGCANMTTPRQKELAAGLSTRIGAYISPVDRGRIAAVTGVGFEELAAAVLGLDGCAMAKVLSSARFVPHELNAAGLHLLRALLAERMYTARVEASGCSSHPDYEGWRRDGVLVKDLDELGCDDTPAARVE